MNRFNGLLRGGLDFLREHLPDELNSSDIKITDNLSTLCWNKPLETVPRLGE